ncbi:PKD domain-containing protein [Desulforhopalus sp. 52FAK]
MKILKLNKLLFVTICTVLLCGLGVTFVVAKDYSFSWSANVEPVEGYKLYYKKGGSAGPPFDGADAADGVSPIDLGKVTSFTITGLEDNSTYHFALTAYNGSEESDFTDVITVVPDTPDPPVVIGASYPFSWSANTEPVEGYKLYYKKGGSAGPPFDGADAAEGASPIDLGKVTSFTITGLEDNTTYHFALTAYNGSEESDFTDVITVFPDGSLDPPVADLSASVLTGPVPLNVTFNGSGSTGTISSYSWDFGDNSSAGSGESITHTYNVAGSYTVVLTVSDAAGQTSQKSLVIVASGAVASGASYPFSWSANAEPVEGYKLYYKKGGSAGPPFDGADATEGASPIDLGKVTSFTITGLEDNTTYHFALTAYNGSEESDFTDVITVFPDGSPEPLSATILADSQAGEAPFTVNFSANGSTGSITNYTWVFGDGGTGTGNSVSHTYQDSGTYTAILTVGDGAGQTEQASVDITVAEPLSATIVADSQSGEAPFTVNFSANGSTGSITNYTWVFGDGGTGTGNSVSHTYQDSGTYTAVLTVGDGAGQTEQASVNITVAEPPPTDPPVAGMSASVTSGEAPLTVTFNGNSSTSVVPPISAYNWDFGDSSSGNGASVVHVYSEAGSYTAVLTVEDSNGVSEEVSTTITVTAPLPDPPVADLSVSLSTGPVPLDVTFSGSSSTGTISSYVWDFGDNSSAGSGEAVAHTYDVAGSYTVILTVTDVAGQTSQKTTVITAVSAGVSYPFSWSANAEPVEGYKLYYKKGGSAEPPFDGTDAAEGVSPIDLGKVTSFTITGLEDNTTYHFALTAYNGSEESDYTDVITVFPEGSTDPLSANISVDGQTGDAPLTVNFDGSGSTGSISSYSWNFGDGDTAAGVTANHIYSSVGNYTATLTVVDSSGSSMQDSVVINVTETTSVDLTPPTAVAEVDTTEGIVPFVVGFEGGSSTCAPGNTIVSYEWDFGDGSEKQYGTTVEHYFNQAGTYLVALKVTDSNGNSAEATTLVTATEPVVEENSDPVAVFTQTSTVGAVPFSVEFNASGSSDPDGDNLTYSWTFGDGAVASGAVVEHNYAITGVFSVQLTVEDSKGAATEVSQTIAVLTDREYERFLRGKKVRSIINIINTLLLSDE